jgi:hypothetical protein
MGAPGVGLSEDDALAIAAELWRFAACGATDAQITSRLLGPVMDEHGEDGAMAVIAVTVRALAGLLLRRELEADQP